MWLVPHNIFPQRNIILNSKIYETIDSILTTIIYLVIEYIENLADGIFQVPNLI